MLRREKLENMGSIIFSAHSYKTKIWVNDLIIFLYIDNVICVIKKKHFSYDLSWCFNGLLFVKLSKIVRLVMN